MKQEDEAQGKFKAYFLKKDPQRSDKQYQDANQLWKMLKVGPIYYLRSENFPEGNVRYRRCQSWPCEQFFATA